MLSNRDSNNKTQKVELAVSPNSNLLQELLQGHLSLSYHDDVPDDGLVPLKVHIPDLAQGQLRQDPVHPQPAHQQLPVTLLQGFRLELCHQHVHLEIAITFNFVMIIIILTMQLLQNW